MYCFMKPTYSEVFFCQIYGNVALLDCNKMWGQPVSKTFPEEVAKFAFTRISQKKSSPHFITITTLSLYNFNS